MTEFLYFSALYHHGSLTDLQTLFCLQTGNVSCHQNFTLFLDLCCTALNCRIMLCVTCISYTQIVHPIVICVLMHCNSYCSHENCTPQPLCTGNCFVSALTFCHCFHTQFCKHVCDSSKLFMNLSLFFSI